jgi:hypothetical protein
MPRVVDIPPSLTDRPVTIAMAEALGLTRAVLEGPRFRRIFRGVYLANDADLTPHRHLAAALLVLPMDTVVSHSSAMQLYGIAPSRPAPLELSTNSSATTKLEGVVLHRRQGQLHPVLIQGMRVTGPDRTFVDCSHKRPLLEVVQLGDQLVAKRLTDVDRLAAYACTRHLHGVRRARRLVGLVRAGVESPRETVVRLLIRFAHLPEPECNVDILDAAGMFVARGDLVLPEWMVVVEYDGWYHERDARQRQRDLLRRERLERCGWRVVVITARDLLNPSSIPWRVHAALVQGGYDGPPPRTSVMWDRWFNF